METKFKSQICTDKNQSERLLALGLKRETADMRYYALYTSAVDKWYNKEYPEVLYDEERINNHDIPAWSLHRLIETLPVLLRKGDNYSLIFDIHRDWVAYMAYASGERNPYNRYLWESQNTNIYDAFIDCIEWLIKEGYFNKEYLV